MNAFWSWLRCLLGLRCELPPEDQRFVTWLRGQQRAAARSTAHSQRRRERIEAELARWRADALLGLDDDQETRS